jgi:hypothetical protein
MSQSVKIATFRFQKTGNSCDVWVRVDVSDDGVNVGDSSVIWESSPSVDDIRLWKTRFYPVVCKRMVDLMPVGTKMIPVTEGGGYYLIEKPRREPIN